ncbi:MAG: hypothetical protein H0Z39_11350 [Peptococcaceae bacterium]|nr:hypothetical protein [Peptococcaceae bacterium]
MAFLKKKTDRRQRLETIWFRMPFADLARKLHDLPAEPKFLKLLLSSSLASSNTLAVGLGLYDEREDNPFFNNIGYKEAHALQKWIMIYQMLGFIINGECDSYGVTAKTLTETFFWLWDFDEDDKKLFERLYKMVGDDDIDDIHYEYAKTMIKEILGPDKATDNAASALATSLFQSYGALSRDLENKMEKRELF